MRYGEQLDAEPMNIRGWRAGETCNGSHHDILFLLYMRIGAYRVRRGKVAIFAY